MNMFCDECGSILMPSEDGFACPRCGAKGADIELDEKAGKHKEIHMVKQDVDETMPKVKMKCRNCGNGEATYFVYQTRSADEAPTTFYTCTKCGNRWRDYG